MAGRSAVTRGRQWSPVMGRIEIRFELCTGTEKLDSRISTTAVKESPAKTEKLSKNIAGVLPAEADLLIALDRAEARPGWNFVPLKKFRDEILPQEHFPSLANSDDITAACLKR